jgi:hypothetical protein
VKRLKEEIWALRTPTIAKLLQTEQSSSMGRIIEGETLGCQLVLQVVLWSIVIDRRTVVA